MDQLPPYFFYIAAAVIGLELGGLSSIFIQRWIDNVPICRPGRSICPACQSKLEWRDTLPIMSYFLLRGRCRHCQARIGAQYLLVEISCLAWSLALVNLHGFSLAWGIHLVLGTMLIAGSFIDFETFLLPDRITLGGTSLALATAFLLKTPGWQSAMIGCLVGALAFWVIERLYVWRGKFGVGLGDVKLMAMIGAMVGVEGLPVTIVLTGVLSYLALGIMALRMGRDVFAKPIPYGPFLSLGCMLSILYGKQILVWWGRM
ncbi:prepilin peptidase [Pseudodesulfovibrio piezophilus]|uniref:Prepilin leader peptidase/N-methyltransferase n=1 Tax=Pseudodesulfovibrio piezophilus (strain DSM 21447 / JCM 15486 / C1TLV30) TaxID=1322246 RepID=M1WJQ3_PSEP2|nr:A24 family peptidase [Pseudodesulfovibrio piezophilus]CCH48296.1 Peptidase A24A prepilin type IV [Pseudodesulfovibrio piezophilus C1TLV30]